MTEPIADVQRDVVRIGVGRHDGRPDQFHTSVGIKRDQAVLDDVPFWKCNADEPGTLAARRVLRGGRHRSGERNPAPDDTSNQHAVEMAHEFPPSWCIAEAETYESHVLTTNKWKWLQGADGRLVA
jgi:hypothetical protein